MISEMWKKSKLERCGIESEVKILVFNSFGYYFEKLEVLKETEYNACAVYKKSNMGIFVWKYCIDCQRSR